MYMYVDEINSIQFNSISGDGLCRVKLMHKFLVITFNRPRSAYIENFYTPLTQANNEEFIGSMLSADFFRIAHAIDNYVTFVYETHGNGCYAPCW